jgi:hypothetical protein
MLHLDARRVDFDFNNFFSNHERTKPYFWNAIHHMNLNYTYKIAKWLNTTKFNITSGYYVQDIGPERTKNALLEGASWKLIRGCAENRRKGVMCYFQIKINMYAVIYHIRSHSSSNSYDQKLEATLTLVWFGHHCKHTILIVSYSFWFTCPNNF